MWSLYHNWSINVIRRPGLPMQVYTNCTVYRSMNYMEVVAQATEDSMSLAVNNVKELPEYSRTGEVNVVLHVQCMFVSSLILVHVCMYFLFVQWVITDARHDSTANAYHTTVPCLSGRCVCACMLYFVVLLQQPLCHCVYMLCYMMQQPLCCRNYNTLKG